MIQAHPTVLLNMLKLEHSQKNYFVTLFVLSLLYLIVLEDNHYDDDDGGDE